MRGAELACAAAAIAGTLNKSKPAVDSSCPSASHSPGEAAEARYLRYLTVVPYIYKSLAEAAGSTRAAQLSPCSFEP